MSNSSTQTYTLFQLLKSGKVVSKETIAESLGVAFKSVPVYIHELKKKHKADIEGVRADGRKVVGYRLLTTDVKVPQHRSNSVFIPKEQREKSLALKKAAMKGKSLIAEDGSVPILDPNAEITQISEREFSDIADSLGIGSNYND